MKRRLEEIPEDERTEEVKEKIFTDILGREKGHGRVRTWGLGLSSTDIFGSTSSMTLCSDIIQSIVDEKIKMRMKEYEKQHTDKMNELEKQQKEKLEGLERTQRELNLIIEMYRNGMDRDGIAHLGLTSINSFKCWAGYHEW